MITQNEISSLNLSPTKKDFVQIWNELIEVASKITERWDPTSTNESDPGIVLLKALAGIADKLNYNIDKNILEAYMPTAAQVESMQKLCELVGYDIKYYQSAETTVRISYTGNTSDYSADNTERLPRTFGLALPKFTTITNADKDITFVTTNPFDVYLTNDVPWVDVPCIEGQISQCESINDNNLITLAQLDDNNRYYLPETQIAENGIFVYNAAVNATTLEVEDGESWKQVSNLNVQAPGIRVYKFGYDSLEGRPYIMFPSDVGSLIGDGLFIYFVRTSGLSGNISRNTLEVVEIPTDGDWANYSAEQFEVVNYNATTNGANIENISTAYNNFKKTVGTFDTLVTCRDYMNKIYSLMDSSNSPYVSNILVTDIRSDINSAITLCSFNEFGILYKETPLHKPGSTDTLIDHFDLVLYPFKTFTQVSSGTKKLAEAYNNSFTYTNQRNNDIQAALADLKTCAHRFIEPKKGDVVAINNYLRLDASIATSARVSEAEAEAILKNVKVALVNEFNLRNLDFGEEIPFDSILSVIEKADARIKVVALQEPKLLTTYSVVDSIEDGNASIPVSKEYGIVSSNVANDKINKVSYGAKLNEQNQYVDQAKDIYNKLVLRNILAGRAALFDYDETFVANNAEKPYTITKDITADLLNKLSSTPTDTTAQQIVEAIQKALNDTTTRSGEILLLVPNANDASEDDLASGDSTEVEPATVPDLGSGANTSSDSNEGQQNLTGFNNGVLTLKYFSPRITGQPVYMYENSNNILYCCNIYETYEYDFANTISTPALADVETPATFGLTRGRSRGAVATADNASKGIIKDIKKVKAECQISSKSNTLRNITLGKNEVVKFRAPNLITTKTFPAYVYYRYEKGVSSGVAGDAGGSVTSGGVAADTQSLNNFINSYGLQNFLAELCTTNRNNLQKITAKRDGVLLDSSNNLEKIFKSAIMIFHTTATKTEDITAANITVFKSKQDVMNYLATLADSVNSVTFYYYPLYMSTLSAWNSCIRQCYLKSYGKVLPGVTTLWRLSSTSNYPIGRLVTADNRKLLVLNGDYLATSDIGQDVYICTKLGADPKSYTLPEKGDIELENGDKLYIHYTPSSTNEAGETVNAEPVSIVYTGGDVDNPVILKPSGLTLLPSDDVVLQQNISWKKEGVDFPGHGQKNLLALAPNEQIELRSISKVVLNTPARFYKNFDNEDLEKGRISEYELKDGEYIFYTNQNTQEAAYYGSGSVISLTGNAYIPKTDGLKEVSQILEQGLHIVPWSGLVMLTPKDTVTVTEYQYITLVEGDTIEAMDLDSAAKPAGDEYYTVNNTWKSCEKATYTSASSTSELPIIELSTSKGWEVCSCLELSTSPGHAQELRATAAKPATTNTFVAGNLSVKVKFDTAASETSEEGEVSTIVTFIPTDGESLTFNYTINEDGQVALTSGDEEVDDSQYQITLTQGVPTKITFAGIELVLPQPEDIDTTATATITDQLVVETVSDTGDNLELVITPQETVQVGQNSAETVFEPVSFKLDTIAAVASGELEVEQVDDTTSISDTLMQMKVFKSAPPELIELTSIIDIPTPISSQPSTLATSGSENINNYWTKLDIGLALQGTTPKALNLNFMIPENNDLFGVFSIYLETDIEGGAQLPASGQRVFIDVPSEFGPYQQVISIFNVRNEDGDLVTWWPDPDETPTNKLYLKAGLNCIKVLKSCSILLKAEDNAAGNILYDNLRLVRGRDTNGVNLGLIDFKAYSKSDNTSLTDEQLADELLKQIAELDRDHEFYYTVPVEHSLAIDFDNTVSSFANPRTLYDINNVNNNFVISKLDIDYLDSGLRIANSSRY